MLAGFAGADGTYDLEEALSMDPVELQIEVEYCLRLKGFCVLDAGVHEDTLSGALTDISSLRDEDFRFHPTQPEVLDGILGGKGNGEFCELEYLGAADYKDGVGLRKIQDTVAYFTEIGKNFCQEAGWSSVVPSMTIAVRGDEPDTHNELNEGTAMGWLSTFKLAKLMLVLFLGPGEGKLELTPYDDDSGVVEITTKPGMMVILRYDALMRNHLSTREDYALVRWIWAREKTGPRGWRSLALGLQRKMPALRALFDWARDRMQSTLGLEDEYGMEGPGIAPSREWELMMHHHFFKRDRIPAAVRGVATHMPGMWNAESFWKTTLCGADYAIRVPYLRWDHDKYHDADPDCWMQATNWKYSHNMGRTSINHGCFMDGIELFDCKFFGLSTMESGGMDPQQRHILETSYECMFMGGFKKKDMMNGEIAVYVGTTNPELNYIDMEVGACSGTGSAVAITSNRISFQLGMMGPSSSVECGMASSHMAVRVGITAIIPQHEHRWRTGGLSIAADVGGVFFQITPFTWPRFNAWMNPKGRCCTFDSSANGYVRSEACGNMCLLPYAERVDGNWAVPDRDCISTLVGMHANSNGRNASLTSPSGPCQAEVLFNACRDAKINFLDLDALDCHGIGSLLEDSVEVKSATGVLRGMKGGSEEVLTMGSTKTNFASAMEAAGMVALFKVMYDIIYGSVAPGLHLKQLNPHIELDEEAVHFNSETVAYRERTAFHATTTCGGYCGMNCAHIVWYMVDDAKVRPEYELQREVFSFWPGGGGLLDSDLAPRQGYFILGSWTRWSEPEEMLQEGPGVYTYTVTLGANRFESFQIWLDGDSERVLHPGSSQGMPGDVIQGPVDANFAWGYCWVIEGRSLVYPYRLENSEGRVGDRYQVRLLCSGKYRTVTWKREPPPKLADGDAAEEVERGPVVDTGIYYVAVEWAKWGLHEMVPSAEVPGVYSATVTLPRSLNEGRFVIVRDRDWGQTFYPSEPDAGPPETNEQVVGPDGGGQDYAWRISGRTGETFRIDFQRTFDKEDDLRKVAWIPLG